VAHRQQPERALPADRLRGPESAQRGGRSPGCTSAGACRTQAPHGCRQNAPRPRALPALHQGLSKRRDSGALRQSIVGFCTTLLPTPISTLRPSQPKPVVMHPSAARRSAAAGSRALLDETGLSARACHRSRPTGIAIRHCGGQVSEFARQSGSVRPPIEVWTRLARTRTPRSTL